MNAKPFIGSNIFLYAFRDNELSKQVMQVGQEKHASNLQDY